MTMGATTARAAVLLCLASAAVAQVSVELPLSDNFPSHSHGRAATADAIDYTLVLRNTGAVDLTNVVVQSFLDAFTTIVDGSLQISPTANDDSGYAATAGSSLTVPDGPTDLLVNDGLGLPSATITSFGGGSLGGLVTDHPVHSPVTVAAGTLQVNADGRFAFTPDAGFDGSFTFDYRLTNTLGTSDATVTIATQRAPVAADDDAGGVAAYSVLPGNTLSVANGGTDLVERNDDPGAPAAVVASFGGGSLGGSVTDHLAGASVSPLPGFSDGSLTINADGSLTFVPGTAPTAQTGLFSFEYRLTNVAGSDDATVNIMVGDEPEAIHDSLACLGNTRLTLGVGALFADHGNGPDLGQSLEVTAVDGNAANVGNPVATSASGEVTVSADGSLVYDPPLGYVGADTFEYTVDNDFGAPSTATVTITINTVVWYLDSSAAAAGDGRDASPLNTLAGFQAIQTNAAGQAKNGQIIFLIGGGPNYTGGLVLLASQRLLGSGLTGDLATALGTAVPTGNTLPSTGGTAPVIENAGGNGVNLSTDNWIEGVSVGNTSGSGIAGANFTTLTVRDTAKIGSGQALDLTNGTLDCIFRSLNSDGSAAEGIALADVAGSLTVTGETTILGQTSPDAVAISIEGSSTAALTFGGQTTILCPNNVIGVQSGASGAPNASVTFNGLDIDTFAGTAVDWTGGGFDASGGPVDIDTTDGLGLRMTGRTHNTPFRFGDNLTVSTGTAIAGAFNNCTLGIDPGPATSVFASASERGLAFRSLSIGPGGLAIDSVTSGGGADGLLFEAVLGAATIGSASLQGNTHAGLAIDTCGGQITVGEADIDADAGTSDAAVLIRGNNGTINLGTSGNGLDIDGGSDDGIEIAGSGTVNLGTGPSGRISIDGVPEDALQLDGTGTVNVATGGGTGSIGADVDCFFGITLDGATTLNCNASIQFETDAVPLLVGYFDSDTSTATFTAPIDSANCDFYPPLSFANAAGDYTFTAPVNLDTTATSVPCLATGFGDGTLLFESTLTCLGGGAPAIALQDSAHDLTVQGLTTVTSQDDGVCLQNAFGAINFAGLDVSIAGGYYALDLYQFNGTFSSGSTTITGDGSADSFGIDLSQSTNPNGPNSMTPNVVIANGPGQTATISGVETGVLLGDGSGSAGANLLFGNQAEPNSGSSIDVTAGGVTIDTTDLVSTDGFTEGRYEFAGVTFGAGDEASFESTAPDFFFVAQNATGSGDGSTPSNRANGATLVTELGANNLAGATVVLINDGNDIDLGGSNADLNDGTILDGFGNGHSFANFSIPVNVIVTQNNLTNLSSVTDPTGNGTATLLMTGGAAVRVADGNTIRNVRIAGIGGSSAVTGNNFTGLTIEGATLAGGNASVLLLTNAHGVVSATDLGIDAANAPLGISGGDATISLARGTAAAWSLRGIVVGDTTGGSVAISGAAASTSNPAFTTVTLTNNTAAVTLTDLAATYGGSSAALQIDAVGDSTGAIIIDGNSTITTNATRAIDIRAGARDIDLSGVALNDSATATNPLVDIDGQTAGTIDLPDLSNTGSTATNVVQVTNMSGGTLNFGDVDVTDFGDGGSDLAVSLAGNGGTVTFDDLDITAVNGGALQAAAQTIDCGASPTIAATGGLGLDLVGTTISSGSFGIVSSANSPTRGINLDTCSGTLTINGGSITGATGSAFRVASGSPTVTYSGAITNSAGLATEIRGTTGGSVTIDGPSLTDSGGGISIEDTQGSVSITPTTGALTGSSGLRVWASPGDVTGALRFDNLAISDTSSANVTLDADLDDDILAAVDFNNVDLVRTGAALASVPVVELQGLRDTTVDFDSASAIQTSADNSGIALDRFSGTNTVTFAGPVDLGTAANRLTDSTALTMQSVAGTTVNFGDLDIFTSGQVGILADSGTINVTDGGDGNVIDALNGTAISLTNTTIGASGMIFDSVSSSGAANGIVLNNTGTTGAFTVSGDGAMSDGVLARNGSGGTLNTTGFTINLTNAWDVTLRQMNLDSANHAIRSFGGGDFTFSAILFDGPAGDGWNALNLAGTNRVDNNSRFTGLSGDSGIFLVNTNTDLGSLTIDQCTFDASTANFGIWARGSGTSNFTLNITDSNTGNGVPMLFDSFATTAVEADAGVVPGSSASGNVTISDSVFRNATGTRRNNLRLESIENSQMSFLIEDNAFEDQAPASDIEGNVHLTASGSGVLGPLAGSNGLVRNNTFTGCDTAAAIRLTTANSASNHNIIIDTNTVTGGSGFGLDLRPNGSTTDCDVRVVGNTFGTAASPLTNEAVILQAVSSAELNLEYTNNDAVNSHATAYTLNAQAAGTANLTFHSNTFRNLQEDNRTALLQSSAPAATMCLDLDGNDAQGDDGTSGDGWFSLLEADGTFNVEQADQAALEAANTGNFNIVGITNYNVPCPSPTLLTALRPAPGRRVAGLDRRALPALLAAAEGRLPGHLAPEVLLEAMAGNALAAEFAGQVRLSPTAAGWGWFVDPTPDRDEEFEPRGPAILPFGADRGWSTRELFAFADGPAAGKMDLLTVLLHEIGHVEGEGHVATTGDLMNPTLDVGIRRIPVSEDERRDITQLDAVRGLFAAVGGRTVAKLSRAMPATALLGRPRVRSVGGAGLGQAGNPISYSLARLPVGDTVTIRFQATIDSDATNRQVSASATVAADSLALTSSNDPDTALPNDTTVTPLELPASATLSTAYVPNGAAGSTTSLSVSLRDQGNNLKTIGGDTVSIAVSGANTATPTVTDQGNGNYTATYTPTLGGADQVAITVNGVALNGSPFTSTVSAGSSSAAQASATVPAGAVGRPTTITVQAKDALGNNRGVGGDTVVVAVSGSVSVAPPVVDHHDGTYTASYTPTAVGTDTVAISLNGPAIAGSPFSSVVGPGASRAATSTATVPNGTAGSLTTITVQARDGGGFPTTSGGDDVVVAVSGANSLTLPVTDHGNGAYTATYVPLNAGTDHVAISLNTLAVQGSPYTSLVSVGRSDATRSTATVPNGAAGQVTTITVQARDASGNPRTVGGDTVVVAVKGSVDASPPVTDHGDGTYTAQYLPTRAGTDTVAISLNGPALGGSPFSSVVSAGATDPDSSTATVPNGVAGQTTTITIQAIDALGNLRTTGGDTVVVAVRGGASLTLPVTDHGDGSYTASYTPTVAGTDTVSVSVNGPAIGGNPFDSVVSPGPSNYTHSTAEVPSGAVGLATTITVQARDAYDNPRTTGGDTVVVAVEGSVSQAPLVTDHGDGTYTAAYWPAAVGTDTVAISLNGPALGGSPFSSKVVAGPANAAHSTANVPSGVAGYATTITIQARDVAGNPRTIGGDTVVVAVSGGADATLPVTDHGDGSYTASYTPTVAGTDTIAISMNGPALGGSPFSSTVVAGPADPLRSTANVPNGVAGQTTTITVQARDALGNARSSGGDTVVVAVSGGASLTLPLTDHGNGTYIASYVPTVAGTDTVAISLNGPALGGSPFSSTVSPAAVDPDHSSVTLNKTSAAANGIDVITGTAVLRDVFDNLLAGVAANQFAITGSPAGLTITGPAAPTAANGSATFTLASTTKGSFTVTIQVGTVTLSTQPAVAFRDQFTATLPAGLTFLGLPFVPDNNRPEAVVGSISATQVAGWRVPPGEFVRYHLGDTSPIYGMTAGNGLWTSFSSPVNVSVLGQSLTGPFSADLQVGSNALGNPFDAPLTWDPAQIQVYQNGSLLGPLSNTALWSKVEPYVWYWDPASSGYLLAMVGVGQNAVPAHNGFWLDALESGIRIVVPASAAGRASSRAVSAGQWTASLQASVPGGGMAATTIGVDPSLGRSLGLVLPPNPLGEPSVALEVVTADRALAGEIRATGREQTWDLRLRSRLDGDATIAWPSLLRDLPRGLLLELQDPSTGQRWLLNTRSAVTLPVTRGADRALRLVARFGNLTRTAITGLQLRGHRGAGQTIELQLTGPAKVTVTVKGLAGRTVRQLTTDATSAGPLQVTWDGLDQQGRPVPRGNYLLEAVAESDNGASMRVTRTVSVQ